MESSPDIYVLGLGNILCGDDGFGSHLATLLQANYFFGEKVTILDLGVQSNLLTSLFTGKSKFLFLDAADFGKAPGALFHCSREQIPVWLASKKLSAHQASLAEALALAALCGQEPLDYHLIAFQPCKMEFGASVSASCQNALLQGMAMALDILASWGYTPAERTTRTAHMHPDLRLDCQAACQDGSN